MKARPWEKQESETIKAFSAFRAYRDLGEERSLAKAAALTGKGKRWLEFLSSKFAWQDRIDAWEREQDRIRIRAERQEVERMAKRQAQQSTALANALFQPVIVLSKRLSARTEEDRARLLEDMKELEQMPLSRLIGIINGITNSFNTAIKLERICRGEPSEILRQQEDISIYEEKVSLNLVEVIERYADSVSEARKHIQSGLSDSTIEKDDNRQ